MRFRWLPVALALSALLNVGLAVGWGLQLVSEAVLASDTGSTFDLMGNERRQLHAMRAHFCPQTPAPNRDTLLAWEEATRAADRLDEPFEKDGLLWLRGAGVKLDPNGRLEGVCLSHAWERSKARRFRRRTPPASPVR